MITETRTETPVDQIEQHQRAADFKMVTFSLAGKDYGIDIMRVKEIAKFAQFTYVPNTARYVRGVYNLRGDIISIIDLRLMFNLPVEPTDDGHVESGLILRLDNNLLGVVVDSIDKVVGFSSAMIQPPHPIFGDINVKFISGVVEHQNRLYIILDVDRIFSRDEPRRDEVPAVPATTKAHEHEPPTESVLPDRAFLREGLATFLGFHVTGVNEGWCERRFEEWVNICASQGRDPQFRNDDDASEFLKPFFSRDSEQFWSSEHAAEFARILPVEGEGVFHLWNPGCGSGYEAYSAAMVIQETLKNRQKKIWAGDKDLMKISAAPNISVSAAAIPEEYREFLQSAAGGGQTFVPEIKEMILFEFSDIAIATSRPPLDVVLCRDVISFLKEDDQKRFFIECAEIIKPGGLLILGDREVPLDQSRWEALPGGISAYRRR